ncbi:hypothetical protein FACS1894184_04760 [Clostridia bacterium]|nr:hypothetical protein FACS1894184_04760 [Clostridia bacterium]
MGTDLQSIESRLFSELTEAFRVAYRPFAEKIRKYYDLVDAHETDIDDWIESNAPLNALAAEIHQTAIDHGWWDAPRGFPEVVALIHSELSEALEEHRAGRPNLWHVCEVFCKAGKAINTCGIDDNNCPRADKPDDSDRCCMREYKPEGVAVELADAIIRILDYCAYVGIDIDSVVREKMEYNKSRPYRHGGKLA